MNRELTDDVVMTTDVRSNVDWELLANLKPNLRSPALKTISPSSFSEVSYPHPWREFKLLKREVVYIFDLIKFKRRYLEKKNITN